MELFKAFANSFLYTHILKTANVKVKFFQCITLIWTLCEGGDGVARFQLALQEAVLWLRGDFVNQLSVLCVWIHGQQLLLGDQVGGLVNIKQK